MPNKIKGVRPRNGSFIADVTYQGERFTETFKNQSDAIKWRIDFIEAKKSGADATALKNANAKGTMTLQSAYDRTYEDHWKNKAGEKPAVLNAGYALSFFGDRTKVGDISLDRIRDYKKHLETSTTNAPTTIDRKVSALSMMLQVAVDEGKLQNKPSFKTILSGLKKDEIARTAYLTEADEAEFLSRCKVHAGNGQSPKWDLFHDFVCFLIDSGARTYKEGLLLVNKPNSETSCIQWHNNTLLFPITKTGKPRSVPMTPRLKRILKFRDEYIRNLPTPHNRIWKGLTKDSVRHYWDTIRAEMGWADDKNYCPYICRHTTASRLVIAGVSLPLVMRFMGHRQWSTTLGYAHLAPSDLDSLADALAKPEDKDNIIKLPNKKSFG